VLLVVAVGLVLAKTYFLWTTGPWDLPSPVKSKSPIAIEGSKVGTNPPAVVGTETIISKNIFDPERGAGFTREVEASSQAYQRIKNMVLLGTAILGNNRFAILQDGASSSGAQPGLQPSTPLRIKLGDTVEGFKLSEISEKRVVFARGASTVEVPLDYFRKTDIAQPPRPATPQPGAATTPGPRITPRQIAPVPRAPRAIPALPRRDREPAVGE
jgi:hypothetical protein